MLQDLLRDTLGFDGFVSSDYASIERLVNQQQAAADAAQAGRLAIEAGNERACQPKLQPRCSNMLSVWVSLKVSREQGVPTTLRINANRRDRTTKDWFAICPCQTQVSAD